MKNKDFRDGMIAGIHLSMIYLREYPEGSLYKMHETLRYNFELSEASSPVTLMRKRYNLTPEGAESKSQAMKEYWRKRREQL